MLKVNLGCGRRQLPGYVNVDVSPVVEPDIVWDLEKSPYPFDTDSVEEVFMEHCLEHLEDIKTSLREIYRILKPGGKFVFLVPHFSYGFAHPFHKRGFGYGFHSVLSEDGEYELPDVRFTQKSLRFRYTRLDSRFMRVLAFVLDPLANLHHGFCERIWCRWVGGFEEMRFEWVAEKPSRSSEPPLD